MKRFLCWLWSLVFAPAVAARPFRFDAHPAFYQPGQMCFQHGRYWLVRATPSRTWASARWLVCRDRPTTSDFEVCDVCPCESIARKKLLQRYLVELRGKDPSKGVLP